MKTNILATASALSDHDLLARLEMLAQMERETSAELVAHLAALDARPALYAAQGYGSLFGYCTQALRLSEDAACSRIEAARACRRFPLVLELLASGSLTLTSVRLLGRHLTAENHQAVLAKARDKGRRDIEALVAELAPRPDVASGVRKLPGPRASPAPSPGSTLVVTQVSWPGEMKATLLPALGNPIAPGARLGPLPSELPPTRRPVVKALAPGRYGVQFTIGPEANEKLRRLQALLRREIPNGDVGVIFDRAMTLLLEKVEKAKLGAPAKPRATPAIRPGTDKIHSRALPSRHVPQEVKRVVWRRDAGQCAYVSLAGRRCSERTLLELHHIQPYAREGPATVGNISLRCRRHNQYEAELVFGHSQPSLEREVGPGP